MNELQIIVNESPAVISTNFEEVRDSLTNMMQAYEGLTYTDDTVKDARTDVATLRKIRKAIEDKRKEVKKSHMIPYEEFESQCKELVDIIDCAINPINQQIEEYSERKRQERKAAIKEYFDSKIGDLDCLKFEEVFLEAWITNMSTTMKLIKSVIDAKIEEVTKDIESIKAFNSEVENKAMAAYINSKKLADAVKIINDYEQQKREILAREEAKRKEEEERRRREEERRRIEEEQRKAREEAAKQAEEERRRKEEETRIEREKQEAIGKAKAEERARIERELAAKVKIPESNPFANSELDPFQAAVPQEDNNQFGQVDSNPFGQAETEESQPEEVERVTGEVEPFATSQQILRSAVFQVKATDEQIADIEQYLLSIDVSFIKQVM